MIVDYKLGEYNIKVFPENFTENPFFLTRKGFICIGGLNSDKNIGVAIIDENSRVLDKRAKVFLSDKDVELNYLPGDKIKVFRLEKYAILPLIGFEIFKPSLWKQVDERVDLVTHHLETEIWDEEEAEGWRELQKGVVDYFKCDLVCSFKKVVDEDIDISGIVRYER